LFTSAVLKSFGRAGARPSKKTKLEGALADAPKFLAVREQRPPEKPFAIRCRSTSRQSPVANRCRFGSVGASSSQKFSPTEVGVQRNRHQLRVKTRSMGFDDFVSSTTKTNHATDFSQWLMTDFLSAEFIRRWRSF